MCTHNSRTHSSREHFMLVKKATSVAGGALFSHEHPLVVHRLPAAGGSALERLVRFARTDRRSDRHAHLVTCFSALGMEIPMNGGVREKRTEISYTSNMCS